MKSHEIPLKSYNIPIDHQALPGPPAPQGPSTSWTAKAVAWCATSVAARCRWRAAQRPEAVRRSWTRGRRGGSTWLGKCGRGRGFGDLLWPFISYNWLFSYFYGIIHSINGVLLVLITYNWPQLWRFSWNNIYVTCLYKLRLVDEIIIDRTYEKIIRSSSSIGWMLDVFSLSLVI
jgi:hypothetical protein